MLKISILKTMGKIIRNANISDLNTISDFQKSMAWETENLDLDKNIVSKGVSKVLNDPSTGAYYLVEIDGKIVASTLVLYEWSDWRNAQVLWIHSVYVVPEFRKKGVFSFIYSHLREKVNENREYKGLRLYVDKRNTLAQNVYKKLGMNDSHYTLFEWMKE